ncbi:alginate lyase family protein [Flavobacterium muglaense]|uniref:Alginate lyase family protein n=1 Tax=Flavobacterium muglaense TaxID=2764716 RepID=A0A923SEL8_9FLAO|nr:alginate lyase family protein [Flavobacterium muglaense]MBC5836304.1 alginate lyase family protein [Flavobacterium muglaense]MBC5842834.1 alginate lyase family protein [Flavobacterium muglaense]
MIKTNWIPLFTLLAVVNVQAQLRVWNIKSLDEAKDKNTIEIRAIIKEANEKLNQTLVTVVDKEMTPSSGDKHDYMSMGRYWWPDPTKTDGLPYIRKDGQSNPEIEKLDRYPLSDFARSVETLALAYHLTTDEKYAEKAVADLRIWFLNADTKMNPNMDYGQTIPGVRNGMGRGEGILDTYSFFEMLDAVEILKESKAFETLDQMAIQDWFKTYVSWLQTSTVAAEEQQAKNNHGTAFDVQLTRYALFIGDHELAKKIVNQFAENRLFTQIEPDGSQPLELERTTALGYSTFNLTHFLDMAQMAKSLNIDLLHQESKDGRSILKAIEFLVPYVNQPQAVFPYQQIKEWEAVQENLRWQLYRVDKMLEKPLYNKYYKNRLKKAKKNNTSILY